MIALAAVASAVSVETITKTKDGRARMVFGELGSVEKLTQYHAESFLAKDHVRALYKMVGGESFTFRNSHHHEKIATFRFDQHLHGLEVYGGELNVHITPETLAVHGLTGNVAPFDSTPTPDEALPLPRDMLDILVQKYGHDGLEVTQAARLMYVIDDEDMPRLAYKMEVLSLKDDEYRQGSALKTLQPYDIYIDAITGRLIMDIPHFQAALTRHVYDEKQKTDLPGTLVRSEGQAATNDQAVNDAYDFAGYCYNYYLNLYNRDSWDNMGSPLNSSVHYDVKYDNAFWNGNQMVYGDGDNIIFANFTSDLTVICHELSHAVTQSTSGLRYWAEPGALNEAFSDIMGSSSAVYTQDPKNNIPNPATAWIIGHNVTLINLNPTGCPDCPLGLRYMDNPALDGSSSDYYPDRYTGFQDERGVHWNSGIANLAYVLTVQGGVHPQQKTNNFVQPAGIAQTEQVYYTGFTQYMTVTSQFADAKAATVKAARVLGYSQAVQDSVSDAWTAVGVN